MVVKRVGQMADQKGHQTVVVMVASLVEHLAVHWGVKQVALMVVWMGGW